MILAIIENLNIILCYISYVENRFKPILKIILWFRQSAIEIIRDKLKKNFFNNL